MSEVKTRLSADNSEYKSVLDESVNYAANIAGKIANKFEFRDVARTLATTLGLNLEKLADGAARLFTGVSKSQEEAFKSIDQLSTEVATRQIKAMHEKLSLNDQYEISLREQEAIERRIANNVFSSTEKQAEKLRDQLALLDKQAESKELAAKMDEASNRRADEYLRAEEKRIKVLADAKKAADEEDKKRADEEWNTFWDNHDKKLAAVKEDYERLLLEQRVGKGLTEEEGRRLEVLRLLVKERKMDQEAQELLAKGAQNLTPVEKARLDTLVTQRTVIEAQVKALDQVNEKIAAATPLIESNIAKWNEFVGIITSTGKGDKDLSDRALQKKIDTIKQDIFERQVASPGQADFFLNPQRSNLAQAQAELDLRNRVRANARNLGEDRAFAAFGGSEQRFRDIIQGIDFSTQGRIADGLDALNKRLGAGIPTIIQPGT